MARIALTLFVIAATAAGAAAQQTALRNGTTRSATVAAAHRTCETEALDNTDYGLVCFDQS